ncbi:hypothetical protein B0T20DRAFT_476965 [Sordaria brevicollis]|uniref:Uncharacterized protein n=1 Tax=Sordaria brevicollis TaxID=83679 RepID=A0AAE0PJ67_SORBR|nr:hypothetical protein B0T20DRAFT_476965 [Sordaria brevicollis]
MPSRQSRSTAPSPKSERTGKITDNFKASHLSEPKQAAKRGLEDDDDNQPAKKPKPSDDKHADSIRTTHHPISVKTQKTMKPVSSRLLDDTDGGLNDSLEGRHTSSKETPSNNVRQIEAKHSDPSFPERTPSHTKHNTGRKPPASSRLLDDTDGGLADSLAGRSESAKSNDEASTDENNKQSAAWVKYPMGQPLDGDAELETKDEDSEFRVFEDETAVDSSEDAASVGDTEDDDVLNDITPDVQDAETETELVYPTDDDLSGNESGAEEDEVEGIEADQIEVDESDQDDAVPKVPHNTPELLPVPATPEHHAGYNDDSAEGSPASWQSESISSLILPSPVADLPPIPSSSSPSTVGAENPSGLATPPSSH